ncbi:MAG: redoxin domain-containing protein [Lachnospiraceae bacterium]|nr:redoxin domain-containing protein [Lachnospiraceae bacterium]
MKLKPGMKMFDFDYETPWEKKNFYKTVHGKPCCLMFLRYYGCSTCQLSIRKLMKSYGKIQEMGAELLIVLQSEPETIRGQAEQGYFPFDIICDLQQELYRRCEIGENPHPDQQSERLQEKIQEARSLGIQHGKFEGNELQAPATVVMNQNQMITYVWYGEESIDVPEEEELFQLLREAQIQ